MGTCHGACTRAERTHAKDCATKTSFCVTQLYLLHPNSVSSEFVKFTFRSLDKMQDPGIQSREGVCVCEMRAERGAGGVEQN